MKKTIYTLLMLMLSQQAQAILTPMVDSIPMADGRKLAADIYIPSGISSGPVILIQTPYNRQLSRIGLPLGIGQNINTSNYIFVVTDWRGFYGSAKAAYIGSPDRGSDGYATVEWIAGQAWSNGKVGTWGPSALGKVQFQTAKRNPPHLVCICPSVAAPQFEYNEYYPNGCLRTEYVEQLDGLGFGMGKTILDHPHKDLTWTFTESANDYPDSIRVPCFMVGGWYDHNTQLMMDYFEDLRFRSFFTVRTKHKILMGPWVHGGNGPAKVGTSAQGELSYPVAAGQNDSMSRAFFDFYLRGINNGWESIPAYTYFQMGEDKWLTSNNWPPSGLDTVRFYLQPGGFLYNNLPAAGRDSASYVYNPLDPSPTVGGSTLRNDLDQGPYDQRNEVESRSDRVLYTSKAFSTDAVIKGNIKVHLRVSSSRIDTDFDVRLTDVYPDGRSMLFADGVMRMRFRNGFSVTDTSFMVPGRIYDCIITLPATCLTLKAGHKLRLIVSSSNYPRFNRNMNNGGEMYPGGSTDSVLNPLIASNTVYADAVRVSYLEIPMSGYVSSMRDDRTEPSDLNVYPVPAAEHIRINCGAMTGGELIITDRSGRELMRKANYLSGEELDVSFLSQGIYFIRIINGAQTLTQYFIR